MRSRTPITLLGLAAVALALVVAIPALADEPAPQPMNHDHMQSGHMQHENMPHATMMKVYTADSLYTCPMHSSVISADPKQDCPICGMHLTAMKPEASKVLRSEELVGCPMDPIVMVKGDKDSKCPVCGMTLSPIPVPAKAPADSSSMMQTKTPTKTMEKN